MSDMVQMAAVRKSVQAVEQMLGQVRCSAVQGGGTLTAERGSGGRGAGMEARRLGPFAGSGYSLLSTPASLCAPPAPPLACRRCGTPARGRSPTCLLTKLRRRACGARCGGGAQLAAAPTQRHPAMRCTIAHEGRAPRAAASRPASGCLPGPSRLCLLQVTSVHAQLDSFRQASLAAALEASAPAGAVPPIEKLSLI